MFSAKDLLYHYRFCSIILKRFHSARPALAATGAFRGFAPHLDLDLPKAQPFSRHSQKGIYTDVQRRTLFILVGLYDHGRPEHGRFLQPFPAQGGY